MKRSLPFTVLLIFLCACQPCPSCPLCPPCAACPTSGADTDAPKGAVEASRLSEYWFVTRVVDGDTLVARQTLPDHPVRNEYIRLLSINTPEKGQPLFEEATEALKTLVRAGDIRLEFKKPGVESRDGYGRLLAYVFAGDVNVNVEIVRQGFSRYWTRYGKSRFEDSLKAAEGEAKQKSLGIHALKTAVPMEEK